MDRGEEKGAGRERNGGGGGVKLWRAEGKGGDAFEEEGRREKRRERRGRRRAEEVVEKWVRGRWRESCHSRFHLCSPPSTLTCLSDNLGHVTLTRLEVSNKLLSALNVY